MRFITASFLALMLTLAGTAFAQTTNVVSSSTPDSEIEGVAEEKDDRTSKKGGRVEVPPEKARPIAIPKIDESDPIVIDGNLDEPVWASAAKFKDFYQTSPGDNIAPSKPTEAYMVWDEKHLYIAFKCWDDKDKIRATVAKRDGVFGEDNVRVWLDTYDDRRRAYILGWNPLGIQADGIFIEGQGQDFSVDIVMESKGVIQDWGWSVEVKIPFKSLRYAAGKGKHWGFNAARNIERFNDEIDSWMPDDRNVSGFLIKHGRITGFDSISTERTIEVIPSVTFSETGTRVPDNAVPEGRFVNQPIKSDFGVTVKYSLTPNITLDAAVNPDFAEIEADAPIVEANRRFPVFFPEKRPFFLEGSDVFNSPLRVFNSRSIVDPDVAAKLTGKIGKNSFGFLVASDNAPGNFAENDRNDPNTRPFIDEYLDQNAMFAVLRLKRDFGKENNIGTFFTARTFPENRNFVGGLDGRIKVDPSTVFSFQGVLTHSRGCFFESSFDPDDDPAQAIRNGEICGGGIVSGIQELGDPYSFYRSGNGFGYFANLDHTKDTFGYVLEFGGRSADYRANSGFTRRTDSHYLFGGFRRSTKSKPKASIVRMNLFSGFSYSFDGQGRIQDTEYNGNANLNFQKNTFINFFWGIGHGRIYEDEFGLTRNDNRDGAFFGEDLRK
ncbi:MAG: carbohydrate binding family 9 domain-containing protein, partial [Acidobacteriota bacterium]|nr:carbohydrate binding family 9 domain-containing protein [Acidobacteriota bacterium]